VLSQREPEYRLIFLVSAVSCTHGFVPPSAGVF
jgi:hypothetical protein